MKVFQRIISLALSLLLLFSTTGVTLHKHFCMGELKEVQLNKSTESCMEKMQTPMTPSCGMDCCQDITEEYKVDQFNKDSQKVKLDTDKDFKIIMAYVLVDFEFVHTNFQKRSFLTYKPPLTSRDIPVLISSFLI